MKKALSSFAALNIVQFLSALNDNIFKLLLVFLLIHIKGAQASNAILATAGIIFVIPFLLFASLAGTIADRFSKRRVILFSRFIEILIMILAVVMIALQSAVGGYVILFLMATTSSIFSPCKFGILPEIVKKEKISHYNGIMIATTYLAIIVGTFLASLLTDVTKRNFVLSSTLCVALAVCGALFSLAIKKTPPQAQEKKVSFHLFSEIYRTLKKAQRIRYLLVAILFAGYFLFIGSYAQLNIIPFAIQSLGQTEIQGGYLFLLTAIGIGIGSFLTGKLSGKQVELGYVPLSTFGMGLVMLLLATFSTHFYLVAPLLVALGILGGFYIVPIEAFIQVASLPEDRGQNVASANFISFLGVITASFLLGFLGVILGLSAASGFAVIGSLTLIVGILLLLLLADQVVRLFVARIATYFWDLEVEGTHQLPSVRPLLLVVRRNSWLDTVVVMALLPRLIRYIVPIEGRFLKARTFLYKVIAILPLDREHFVPLGKEAIKLIRKELMIGHPVCLMQPAGKESQTFREWEESVVELVKDLGIPTLPITIERPEVSKKTSYLRQIRSLFQHKIIVQFGKIHS